jgi:perosamine synthetase
VDRLFEMHSEISRTAAAISLTSPCLGEDDVAAMEHAVRSGAVTEGPIARSFEADFGRFLGVAGAVATNSCTSALVLALAALEIGPGDEVAMPSYTCLALLNAVVQAGATPRLADNGYRVSSMDYNVTAESLKSVVTPRTRAIIVPHMFGVPADIESICALGLPVIEDITLSLGADYCGRPVGAWGDLSVCSFHASKMIACGEGGMLASKDPALVTKARFLNGWADEQPAMRLQERTDRYRLRFNFHLTDVAAALGRSQLRKLPSFVRRRRELAARYSARLGGIAGLSLPAVDDRPNVFHRYMVAVEPGTVVGRIERFAEAGVEAGRGVYPPLHRFLQQPGEAFPGAERAVDSLISIPIYPNLSGEQVEYVLQVSEEVLQPSHA